jgi:DNA-binding LytR/AlgR family response regulator
VGNTATFHGVDRTSDTSDRATSTAGALAGTKQLARIHRCTIVNLDRAAQVQPLDRRSYVVVLRDGRRQLLDFLLP